MNELKWDCTCDEKFYPSKFGILPDMGGGNKKVVIIGGGPAGLTAAHALLKQGGSACRVLILEASSIVGGISRTIVHGQNRIDLGGHRFFSRNEEVNALWSELMPLQGAPAKDDLLLGRGVRLNEGGPDPEKTDGVMLRRRRISRIYYHRHFIDYPVSVSPSTVAAMGLKDSVCAGLSYLKSVWRKRPEKSLEDFYVNRFGRKLYEMFFEGYTQKLWGVHPSKISPEWGAQRVKGLSLAKALLTFCGLSGRQRETSLIEEFSYPKRGPGQFWETMASAVKKMGGEVRCNARVVRLEAMAGGGWSVVLEGGETIMADAVFSSMPISDLVAAIPVVPEPVREVAAALPYRDFMTVGLLVDRLAITNRTKLKTVNDIVPDTWIYVQDRSVKLGRIQIFNNWSPYMVDDITKHVWIGLEYFCTEGDGLWEMSDSEFVTMAASELRDMGILGSDVPVLDSVRIKVKKAYPAYFGAYERFGIVREWLAGCRDLFCIGRNGQHRYNNMDHSMLCGLVAARAFLGGEDATAVWNVNAEQVYHEERGVR